jgi:hypothetical protein
MQTTEAICNRINILRKIVWEENIVAGADVFPPLQSLRSK